MLAAAPHTTLWPADTCACCHQVILEEGVLLELQEQAEEDMQRLHNVVIYRHVQQRTHKLAVGLQVKVLQDTEQPVQQGSAGAAELVQLQHVPVVVQKLNHCHT